ncbi:hypothetical protein [Halocatena halophila]|uniref:hypothetical protein n=1 Tax=Halocatena halophila TaxID=2814576 RepID=UPI002ED2EA79
MCYITRGLAAVLLDFAGEKAPASISIPLTVSPATALDTADELEPETDVFTHFYHPTAGSSITAVFGMDLGTPRSQGRFISHPSGKRTLSMDDDLHQVVVLAVPPWEGLTAFDRRGNEIALTIVDAEPPVETVSPSELNREGSQDL